MKVAVIGSGISGLGSAYVLATQGVEELVLYEKEESLGGHAKTVTYPNMMEFFENLGVDMEISDMSFAVSLDNGKGCEWGSRNGVSGLFAQKKNALNPYFWQMIREIVKFKEDVLRYIEELEANPDIDRSETLGEFLNGRGYSEMFQKAYLVPICGSIWSCPSDGVLSFSAYSVLSFCCNHHLLQIFGRPQWLTVAGRSQTYVAKVRAELERLGCKIRTSCDIKSVLTSDDGRVTVTSGDGSEEVFDKCILAMHAPDALRLLGEQVTFDETRVLGAFRYVYSDIYLHHDTDLMPRNQAAWSAWNFLGSTEKKVCVTYWLNILQNLGEDREPFFVTLNPDQTPKKTLLKWTTGHPVPSVAALTASQELHKIQGKRNICSVDMCFQAGMAAARGLLGKEAALLNNPRHMVPSLTETGARLFVTRFLGQFISTGCVTILEEGGTMFNFEGKDPTCPLKSVLKIHSPQFYWKVMTQADLGLADAYINGDFSFVDRDSGLLNFMMILIANRDLSSPKSNLAKKRGWWTPMFLTAGVASAKYFLKHVSRQNTLTQARRNISRHYDLSNELFGLFLDDTMTYSSAVFKSDDEDLRAAQMRKISLLIDKARVEKHHEVLEIGCGWGTLAIEVVRRTGCRYTGITLSIEQLKYAEEKVKEAGLEDRITFKLCDYRQLSDAHKYDRIISCEMLEAVGHEFMEMFFSRCEAALAENGLMVLQFISIPEERYNEYRLSSDFIKEYIFPGGCLPSLARVTSAMSSSSRLCIEHVENIGIHYYQTLRMWRKNFLDRQKPIMALGFDDKFIRTWEYYFDYCAAGFKTLTLGNYQVVFSRPGNVAAFANSYKGFPSAYYVA
uniref:Amine oxidase domain-containing protein n=1 Tax=Brassica campestris TaxID=3711 RepID=M4DEN6_BRACM